MEPMTKHEIASEIIAALLNEKPEAEGAASEDRTSFSFEWNFKDGTKLWLDIDASDGIHIYWRPLGKTYGQGTTLRLSQPSPSPEPVAPPVGDKSAFGYPSNKPCSVCGKHKNNQREPRFCYTVCEDHQNVKPTDIKRGPNG